MPDIFIQLSMLNKLFIALGVLFILNGIRGLIQFNKLKNKGVRVSALIKDEITDGKGASFPIFEYITASGETILKRSYISGYPVGFKIGDQVAIIYDPANPSKFLLADKMGMNIKVIGSFAGGTILIVIAFLNL